MSYKHKSNAAEILRRRRAQMMVKVLRETGAAQELSIFAAAFCDGVEDMLAVLEQKKTPLSSFETQVVCDWVMCSDRSLEEMQTLIDRIPIRQIVTESDTSLETELLRAAVQSNRVSVLAYLLEQGCRPKAWSPLLETALKQQALDSIRLLVQRDDVDFTITENILEIWGSVGNVYFLSEERKTEALRKQCFCAMAGRLLGEGKDAVYSEVPLLPGLTVLHALEQENWLLVCRIARERGATLEQARFVLERYIRKPMEYGRPLAAGAWLCDLMDALLVACPAAMEDPTVRYLLSMALACAEGSNEEEIQAWMECIPEGEILMAEPEEAQRVLFETPEDAVQCLRRWQERLGHRFCPVLLRESPLPYEIQEEGDHDAVIRGYFELCTLRGTAPRGRVSPLAEDVLNMASPGLVTEFCTAGTLFREEDASALLALCEELPNGEAKRTALLVGGIRKKEEYLL